MSSNLFLTAPEKRSLAAHKDWKEWGENFGFTLFGSNDEHVATFICKDLTHFVVPKAARDAIDRVIAEAGWGSEG